MSATVKFPAARASEQDKRFCGLCGRMCQPLVNDNAGFGPCIDDAASPIDCHDLRRAIVQAHVIAKALESDLNPEWAALIARLGIPPELVAEWVAKGERVTAAQEFLSRGRYEGMGGAPWINALRDWVGEADSDERLLLVVEELRLALDPTAGGTKTLSYGEISDWYGSLADRAKDILADPGDWEMGEEE